MSKAAVIIGGWIVVAAAASGLYSKIKASWNKKQRRETPLGVDNSDLNELLAQATEAVKRHKSPREAGERTAYSQRLLAPWEDSAIETSDLPSGWSDTLIVLIERGPVDDGDIPSKNARNALIARGFAAKVILNGEEAGNVATYYGRELYKQLVDAPSLKEAIAKRKTNDGQ